MIRVILLVICLSPLWLQAATLNTGDYRYRKDVEEFIESVAASSEYSEQQLIDLFSRVKHQRHLFERMDKPAEKLQWYKYRKIFLTDKRIIKGKEFWNKHRELLSRVEKAYQVPAEIIVAIVGVETFYGTYKGKSPVFDTLVTFAFDYPKRAAFFTRELEQFLLLSKEQGFDIREVKGSYAGAMGMPQFISSSYRNYAVDFDGDGQANLFASLPDVLGSVANYFKRHGWKAGEGITFPLKAGGNARPDRLESGMKPVYDWKQIKAVGLNADHTPDENSKLALLKLEQKNGAEYWAGQKNFYVITRYNHSPLYAMAVYQLSQKLKRAMR